MVRYQENFNIIMNKLSKFSSHTAIKYVSKKSVHEIHKRFDPKKKRKKYTRGMGATNMNMNFLFKMRCVHPSMFQIRLFGRRNSYQSKLYLTKIMLF